MAHDAMTERVPYPNKCYLPFLLYPPGMHRTPDGTEFLRQHVDLDSAQGDFVIYVGIPFCRTRCKACPYFVSLLPENDRRGMEELYVDILIKDIERWAAFPRFKTGVARDIYIGGGTGSILKTENLKRIVDALLANFNVAEDACITLEGNARDFTDEKIAWVAQSRINRLSLGVQSFQPEILNVIGSPHAALDSVRVIKEFQRQGLRNIQMDLMYNMPGHTLEIWQKDLQILTELDVPHFTIYLYRIHSETPQSRLIRTGRVEKPADPETPMVKAMYREAKRMAEEAGFNMYMVDHFSKPGYENMYNYYNFKVDLDTLGIGPGSYSFIDHTRFGTENDIEKYIDAVKNDRFLISTVSGRLDNRVRRERYVVFALLYYAIEYEFYFKKFGTNFLDDFSDEAKRLERKGLVELLPDRMQLTSLGLIWHTNVILEFFNPQFWGDLKSLNEPNWSLNGIAVEVGAQRRSHWLGDLDRTFYDVPEEVDRAAFAAGGAPNQTLFEVAEEDSAKKDGASGGRVAFTRSYSTTTKASLSELWALWIDVNNWHTWDEGVQRAEIRDGFKAGSSFSLTPAGGEAVKVQLTTVTPGEEFSDETVLPFGVLRGSHKIEHDGDRLRVTVQLSAEVEEAASGFFSKEIWPGMAGGLPAALDSLVSLAEA